MQPAVGIDGCPGRRVIVVVTEHDVVTARTDFPDFADRYDYAGFRVANRYAGMRQRLPGSETEIVEGRIVVIQADHRRCLGLAVSGLQAATQAFAYLAHQLRCD